LVTLALPFVLTMLGIGLWISTRASTRDAAVQLTMGTILPSVFLSGYVFSTDSMPWVGYLSQFVPATWLIDAARTVILRGGGWAELWRHTLVLGTMALAMLAFGTFKVREQLSGRPPTEAVVRCGRLSRTECSHTLAYAVLRHQPS